MNYQSHTYIHSSVSINGEQYERSYRRVEENGNVIEQFFETPLNDINLESPLNTYEQNLLLDEENRKRGLSQKTFNTLKKRFVKQRNLPCSICMEIYTNQDAIYLPCGHIYHKHCIRKWFEESRICPECRKEIEE